MTLTAEHMEAVNKTIIERISSNPIEDCEAQVGRFQKHMGKMKAKAKDRGWGKRGSWPGDADRTYEDLDYYCSQFDKLKDIPAESCEKMVKGFRAGMSVEDALKAFAS